MERYEKYKPSGNDWIGEIPEHWSLATVGRVSNIGRGRVISNVEIGENAGEYPVYSSQTENNGVMGYLNTFDFDGEYVTWTTDGANAGTVFHRKGKFNCTNVCGTIQPKNWEQIDLRYLPYFLNLGTRYSVRLDINPKLMNNMMAKIPFVIPPKKEQATIANYLDDKTAQINTLIEKKQKLIELLKEERTAVINQAVTKGINHKVKLKPSGVEWLGDIPAHWQVKKLKYLASRIGDGIHATPNYVDYSDIYFINGNNLIDGNIVITEATRRIDENEYSKLKIDIAPGSILLSINGTIGNLAFYKRERVVLGKSAAYIEFKGELINNFAYYLFQSSYIKDLFETSLSGTTIKNLSLYTLRNTKMLVPPAEEQDAIVCYIDIETQKIDHTVSNIEKEIELLQEYRTALISEVVTGKIKAL
jgi:type I restriction enzyme, S subunit